MISGRCRSSIRCSTTPTPFNSPVFGGELELPGQLDQPDAGSRRTLRRRSARPPPEQRALLLADQSRIRPEDARELSCCAASPAPTRAPRAEADLEAQRSPTPSVRCSRRSRSVRADAAVASVDNHDPGVSNYLRTGQTTPARVMPTVGVEYRYPFISVQSWGTQTIEPIAQVIVRPNETSIGRRCRTKTAQSLIFDDTNLFRVDKFAGWDRVEGGGRAERRRRVHRAVQRAAASSTCCSASPINCSGTNSFAVGDSDQHRPRQRPRHRPLGLCGAA